MKISSDLWYLWKLLSTFWRWQLFSAYMYLQIFIFFSDCRRAFVSKDLPVSLTYIIWANKTCLPFLLQQQKSFKHLSEDFKSNPTFWVYLYSPFITITDCPFCLYLRLEIPTPDMFSHHKNYILRMKTSTEFCMFSIKYWGIFTYLVARL